MAQRPIAARIESYLKKRDWSFRREPKDEGFFRTGFIARGLGFDLIIHDAVRQTTLLFLIPHIAFVPKERRRDFAELLSELNYGLMLGAYEMDPSDGEVRLKVAVPTDRAVVTDDQIHHCMGVLLGVLNDSYPRIGAFVAAEGAKKKSAMKTASKTKRGS